MQYLCSRSLWTTRDADNGKRRRRKSEREGEKARRERESALRDAKDFIAAH